MNLNKLLITAALSSFATVSVAAGLNDEITSPTPSSINAVDPKMQQLMGLGSTLAQNGVDGVVQSAINGAESQVNSEAAGISKSFFGLPTLW